MECVEEIDGVIFRAESVAADAERDGNADADRAKTQHWRQSTSADAERQGGTIFFDWPESGKSGKIRNV